VSDEPFYAPGHRPPPRVRKPGEALWSSRYSDSGWSAELRSQGADVGWESQIFKDGGVRCRASIHSPGRGGCVG
jgi:hypothetical protein